MKLLRSLESFLDWFERFLLRLSGDWKIEVRGSESCWMVIQEVLGFGVRVRSDSRRMMRCSGFELRKKPFFFWEQLRELGKILSVTGFDHRSVTGWCRLEKVVRIRLRRCVMWSFLELVIVFFLQVASYVRFCWRLGVSVIRLVGGWKKFLVLFVS